MPIPQDTQLSALTDLLPNAIAAYNAPGTRTSTYNETYSTFIAARQAGIDEHGSVYGWILNGNACQAIHDLLTAFGMNAQGSILVDYPTLTQTFVDLPEATVNWISAITIPLLMPPCEIINPNTRHSLSTELTTLYNTLTLPGAVTLSGGFVAASKSLHCLFPGLAPMIDGRHSGLSYYHISRPTYLPPLGLDDWSAWLGMPLSGIPNPSPRGAGRNKWDSARFVAAIGINQHIYELWQQHNGGAGLPAFIEIDPAEGSIGIPRIVDKLLW